MGKIIQMFDVFNIRFGATLVGPTGAGKTTCYRMLAAVMTDLRNKGSVNPEFQVMDDFLRSFLEIIGKCLSFLRASTRTLSGRTLATNARLFHYGDRLI